LVEHDSNSWQRIGCVREGASTVAYKYGGRTHVTHKFFVMVLRHDPTFLYPPYPHHPEGAMDPTGYLFWERRPVFLDVTHMHKSGLGQETLDESSIETSTDEESECLFEITDPESLDEDSESLSSSVSWESQSEEDTKDDRLDSSERAATGPTPLFSSNSETARSGESSGDLRTRSPSGVRSDDARDIHSTPHLENNETSGSNQNSQQLAEKLARAEEEIALLKLENERLRARM